MTTTLTLTPAEIAAAMVAPRYSVTADGGVLFRVWGVLADGTWLVKGERADSPWMAVTVTTTSPRVSRPRVRFTVAQDHGHEDGRITFDGQTFGGHTDRWALDALAR